MSEKKTIAPREVAEVRLKELRSILQEKPEAAQIFKTEVNRRWKAIRKDRREWLCKLSGVPEASEGDYTSLPTKDRAAIRATIEKLKKMVSEFEFALSQW